MVTHITQNDLVAYIYNETDLDKSLAIQEQAAVNQEVVVALREIDAMRRLLNQAVITPRVSSVQAILAYSRLPQ